MSNRADATVSTHAAVHSSLRSYVIGFGLSTVCTLAAYLLVVAQILHGWSLVFAIAGLAIVQCLVQLVFFLHLGSEAKPRLRLAAFLFMLLVVLIVVVGSLWIMHNLNYRMMRSPSDINTYMQNQAGI